MNIFNYFGDLFRNLNQQRLRSFLTIFGIMWGTATLILLLAFGWGFRDQTVLNMRGMGDQLVILFPGQTTKSFEGYGIGRPIRLREADARLLESQIAEFDIATPEYSRNLQVTHGVKRRNSSVGGVYPVYQDLRNIFAQPGGRWLNERDLKERRRVIFLGNRLAENLFGEEDPVGKRVMVLNTPYTVIGVMTEKIQNSSYNQQDRDRSFIPATTFSAIMGTDLVNNLLYTVKDPSMSGAVRSQVYEVMGNRHKFHAADTDALGIWDTNEFWSFINVMFLGINGFLGLIGFFTLAVGGIGVANIMFVIVQERMKEIGIRRSEGARRYHIMGQFFRETFAVISIGAAAGYGIGWLLVQLTQNQCCLTELVFKTLNPFPDFISFHLFSMMNIAAHLLRSRHRASASYGVGGIGSLPFVDLLT